MIWLNPWAWIGASAVALPILIHLLGRGHARAHRFPSLRFLEASRLLPTRRTRLHDVLLLAVRCAVIVLAAAALARPLILTRDRRRSLDTGVARAILVDTSASMRRRTTAGVTALDSALAEARVLSAAAAASVIVQSNNLPSAIASAGEWLAKQGRRGELVVLSDFQHGTVDAADFEALHKEFGIALHRIPVANAAGLESHAAIGGMDVVARAAVAGDRTDVSWTTHGASLPTDAVVLLSADADRDATLATAKAAQIVAVPLPVDTARAVAIVFSTYADAARVKASVTPGYASWMVELLADVSRESLAVTSSGIGNVGGRSRLVLFTDLEPGSIAAARLVAAANRALSVAPPASELESATIPDAALMAMQRPMSNELFSTSGAVDGKRPSDARWVWLAVIALLVVETALRRTRPVVGRAPSQGSP